MSQTLFGKLRKIFRKDRAIVDVDSWDGSEANYQTAASYARASLLNFNPVAGRGTNPDNWVKSLIKLPVRRDDDPDDTYVRQAIYAAAGGRGITAVVRPDEVSQEDFDMLMRRAADELISAYEEMGEVAPASVWEIAGMDPPEEAARAVPFMDIWEQLYDAIWLADIAEETYSYIVDIYLDEGEMFAILIRDGAIYRVDISLNEDEMVILGEMTQIDMDMRERGSQVVFRQDNGRYRWLCIAATSALNRVGEIDSRILFDSFVRYVEETGDYPILNFYHQGRRSRLGKADYVARDGFTYIASGLFDDNKFGRAAAEGIQRDPGYWGNSIEFSSILRDKASFIVDELEVEIPVHVQGINTAISILPESQAAAWFTAHVSQERRMNDKVKQDLQKLFGDEEIVEEFEDLVDGANRSVEGMIHRSTSAEEAEEETTEEEEEIIEEGTDVVEEPATEEEQPATPEAREIVLDETVVPGLTQDLFEFDGFIEGVAEVATTVAQRTIGNLVERAQAAENRATALEEQVAELNERLTNLEAAEDEKRTRWQEDLPAEPQTVVSYRARQPEPEKADKQGSFQSIASETLSKIYAGDQ